MFCNFPEDVFAGANSSAALGLVLVHETAQKDGNVWFINDTRPQRLHLTYPRLNRIELKTMIASMVVELQSN